MLFMNSVSLSLLKLSILNYNTLLISFCIPKLHLCQITLFSVHPVFISVTVKLQTNFPETLSPQLVTASVYKKTWLINVPLIWVNWYFNF